MKLGLRCSGAETVQRDESKREPPKELKDAPRPIEPRKAA